jgi:hypothetical protein
MRLINDRRNAHGAADALVRWALPPRTGLPGLHESWSHTQRNDFSLDLSLANREVPHRHRQFEAPRPGAAGIEIKHAAARLLLRNMAVPRDHDLEPCRFRLQIELCQIVQNINRNAADLDDFSFRQPARPRGCVDIAANGRHGRENRELLKNFRRAHISRVNDVFRSAQRLDRFGPKQPVSVGNDADDDAGSRFWA